MAAEKSSSAMVWLLFLISSIVTIAMLIWVPQWFWVPLPFMLTYLVKGFNAM